MTMIEKMTVEGFKSFSRKTVIPFSKDFNAVCGPNGSGKSNIIDALCFVLGRMSARSMRADKLHELIFKTEKKKGKFAKVTLHLDNRKKDFPHDDDKITVSRSVSRNGVSTYRLNGRMVTRQSIVDYLAPARIHPDGHNIILQGDVTQVIEMNPVERRGFVDEISGIAHYDDKKRKAERELATVEEKLKETGIVISEREEIINKLKAERDAALEKEKLEKELEELGASLVYQKIHQSGKSMETISEQIDAKEKEMAEKKDSIKMSESEIREMEKKLGSMTTDILEKSRDISVMRKIEELRAMITLKKDKLESAKTEIERVDGMISKLKNYVPESRDSRAVKAVMDLKRSDVYGTLHSLISFDAKYGKAMEQAAGAHFQDIVVQNSQASMELIKFLRREKIGRARFLPLDKMRDIDVSLPLSITAHPGIVDMAVSLLSYEPGFAKAVKYAFGPTLIGKTIEQCKDLAGRARVVTLDGDIIDRSGAMTGGYYIQKFAGPSIDVSEYEKTKSELREKISLYRDELEKLNAKLKELGSKEKEEAKEIIDIEKAREKDEDMIMKKKREREAVSSEIYSIQNEIGKLKIKKARLEAVIDNLEIEKKDYPKELMEKKRKEEEIPVIEERLSGVKAKLRNIGPVNMKAIDEYDKFNSIYAELKEKYDKIVSERDSVVGAIEKIEAKRKEMFMKTMTKLSEEFNSVFTELNEGLGELRLEDPEDIDSGLLIRAQPNGKSVLSLDSMSGGEKAMTALAFLFSIQKFRPAPFYVLDEIDASLDKKNAGRVSELIKKMSKKAQFIVITHNDGTIQSADKVYGISMVDGESKVIGLDLKKVG